MAGAEAFIERSFEDVIDFREGPGIMARDFRNRGIPLVRLSGLNDGASILDGCNYLEPEEVERRWSHFKLASGDVLLSTSASLGRIAVVDREGVGAIPYTGIIRMRPRDDSVYAPFLRYLLEGPDFQRQAEMIGAGSVIRHFGPTHLKEMTLRIPPPAQQRAIAQVLGTLDDKIEVNRRMNETLEQMARTLFKSWFVDFDPVRAKMDGRWRAGQSLPGLPAHLYDLFPGRLVPSELGEIPEGWRVKALGAIANQRRVGVHPDHIDPSTPYIALEHMPKRCVALSAWGTSDGLASGKYRFKQGDILFGKLRPYFHKVGVAPLDGVCSTDIVVISPTAPCWFGLVLGHASSSQFVDYTDAASTGTKMPRTKWADMARYTIALPSQEIACSFNSMALPYIDRMRLAIHESRFLSAQRDALLPRLVSGDVRTRETVHEGSP